MSARRVTIVLAAGLLLPAWAAAQGLGDTASRERARREATKKTEPAKLFTNDDLEEGRPPGDPSATEGPAPATPPPAAEPSAAEPTPDRATQERPYMDAVMAAQASVNGIESRVRELQDRLNPMSINYVYGAAQSGDAAGEEARVRQELREAEAQLAEARQALAQANQALEDFRLGRSPSASAPAPEPN